MKKILTLIVLITQIALTGCNATDVQSLTSTSTTTSTQVTTATTSESASVASPASAQKYVYMLSTGISQGRIYNYPIDPTTGALIRRVDQGAVLTSINQSIPAFSRMILDKTGNYLYCLDPVGHNIWIYSIQSNYAYTQYQESNALTYVGTVYGGNTADSFGWGNDGNFYVRNNTGSIYAFKFSENTSTGLLTLETVNTLAATAQSTYGVNFNSNVTQVTNGTDSYQIDTQSNTIIHYQNSVIDGSTNSYSGTISSLILK